MGLPLPFLAWVVVVVVVVVVEVVVGVVVVVVCIGEFISERPECFNRCIP